MVFSGRAYLLTAGNLLAICPDLDSRGVSMWLDEEQVRCEFSVLSSEDRSTALPGTMVVVGDSGEEEVTILQEPPKRRLRISKRGKLS